MTLGLLFAAHLFDAAPLKPNGIVLKDHTIFWNQIHKQYYLVATPIDLLHLTCKISFTYASPPDLIEWTYHGQILDNRTPGSWDENRIWVP